MRIKLDFPQTSTSLALYNNICWVSNQLFHMFICLKKHSIFWSCLLCIIMALFSISKHPTLCFQVVLCRITNTKGSNEPSLYQAYGHTLTSMGHTPCLLLRNDTWTKAFQFPRNSWVSESFTVCPILLQPSVKKKILL